MLTQAFYRADSLVNRLRFTFPGNVGDYFKVLIRYKYRAEPIETDSGTPETRTRWAKGVVVLPRELPDRQSTMVPAKPREPRE